MPRLLLIIICALVSSNLFAQNKFNLPVPPNWRVENTTYPPPWAKSLPWKGTLQLRFPKPFFDASSEFFWSYPILYQLQGNAINNDEQMRRALLEYDSGLYGAQFPKKNVEMDISRKKADDKYPIIVVDGFDPFTTKKPLRTWIVFHRRYDKNSDTTTILLLRVHNPMTKTIRSGKASKRYSRHQQDSNLPASPRRQLLCLATMS